MDYTLLPTYFAVLSSNMKWSNIEVQYYGVMIMVSREAEKEVESGAPYCYFEQQMDL